MKRYQFHQLLDQSPYLEKGAVLYRALCQYHVK